MSERRAAFIPPDPRYVRLLVHVGYSRSIFHHRLTAERLASEGNPYPDAAGRTPASLMAAAEDCVQEADFLLAAILRRVAGEWRR